MEIKQALTFLDPANDAHWTAQGLPLVDAVSAVIGRPTTRQEITDAAPMFTRESAQPADEAEDFTGDEPQEGAQEGQEGPDGQEGQEGQEGAQDAPAGDEASGDAPEEPEAEEGDTGAQGAPQPRPTPQVPDGESVLHLPPHVVLGSRELTARAWEEINTRLANAHARRAEAQAEIDALSTQADVLTRCLDRITKSDPNHAMADIQAYLERQTQERERRAAAARRFLEAGTTPAEVAAAMRTKSVLDQAMARKNTRGAQRPQRGLVQG